METKSVRKSIYLVQGFQFQLHQYRDLVHDQCVAYGKEEDGYIDYVKGANIAGFVKVANAMLDQGVV